MEHYYSIIASTSSRAIHSMPFFEKNAGDTLYFTGVAKMKRGDKVVIYVSTGSGKISGVYALGTVVADACDGKNPVTGKKEKRVNVRLDKVREEGNPFLTQEEVMRDMLSQTVRPQYIRHGIHILEKLFKEK